MKTLDELEAIALAATPGPWKANPQDAEEAAIYVGDKVPRQFENDFCERCVVGSSEWTYIDDEDKTYIIAFDPPTIIVLIRALKQYGWRP